MTKFSCTVAEWTLIGPLDREPHTKPGSGSSYVSKPYFHMGVFEIRNSQTGRNEYVDIYADYPRNSYPTVVVFEESRYDGHQLTARSNYSGWNGLTDAAVGMFKLYMESKECYWWPMACREAT